MLGASLLLKWSAKRPSSQQQRCSNCLTISMSTTYIGTLAKLHLLGLKAHTHATHDTSRQSQMKHSYYRTVHHSGLSIKDPPVASNSIAHWCTIHISWWRLWNLKSPTLLVNTRSPMLIHCTHTHTHTHTKGLWKVLLGKSKGIFYD